MKLLRPKTIHAKIFFRYAFLIALIIILFLVAFLYYTSNLLRTESTRSMQQISANISDTLDLALNNQYSTAQKVLVSSSIKEAFFTDTSDPAVLFRSSTKLADIFLSLNGPKPVFFKLNLYRNDGFRFEYGNQYGSYTGSAESNFKQDWIQETLTRKGIKYISPPHLGIGDSENTQVISLSMAFAEIYGMTPNTTNSNMRGKPSSSESPNIC